jgi:hypothetical protein
VCTWGYKEDEPSTDEGECPAVNPAAGNLAMGLPNADAEFADAL